MNVIAEQKRRVQAAIRSEAVTRSDLAREAGLRKSVMTGVMREDWNPSSDTLERLVEALDRLGFFCPQPRRPVAAVA